MSKPFTISSVFTSCVNRFDCIQFGRQFGRESQTNLIAINCSKLRLTRWGESVHIYSNPSLGGPNAITAAIGDLLQILGLFTNAEDASKAHESRSKFGEDLSAYPASEMEPELIALINKIKGLAIKRQTGSQPTLTNWVVYDKAIFPQLLNGISLRIDDLEKLFPATEARTKLVIQEVAAIGDKGFLEQIANVVEGLDSLLYKTIKGPVAEVILGDEYDDDWKRGAIGENHNYSGVVVGEGARALLGNKYGGKDFWDD